MDRSERASHAPASTLSRVLPRLSSVVLALVACAPIAAQTPSRSEPEDPPRQSDVVVHGERLDAQTAPTVESAREEAGLTPGGVDIVDESRYRGGRVSNLTDALAGSAGVFVASRFGAEESRLSIRGSGLQRTFHLRGITLLQDGVPLTLADGSTDFQAIEPLATRYIQVWRGSNALRYGSTTLGGAIDFASRTGFDVGPWELRGEAGSFGYRRAQLQGGGANDEGDWYASLTGYRQDGFREHSRQHTTRFFGNLGLRPAGDLESRFYLALVDTVSQLPGSLTRAELDANPRMADPAAVAGDQQRNFRLVRLANRTVLALDAQRRLELGVFVSHKNLFHPIFQVLRQVSDDVGIDARHVVDGEFLGRRNRLVVGVLAVGGRLDDDRFRNVGGDEGARTADSRQRSHNVGLYAENHHWLTSRTALVLGGQWVHSRRRLDDRFLSDGDQSVDRSYRRFAPKLGTFHDLSPTVRLYANVSDSFEPPSFGELAGGSGVTPVDAQRATTVEIGTRGSQEFANTALRWDVSLYRAALRNELLSLTDESGQPLGTVNAGRSVHQGLETAVELLYARHWRVRAGYQFNDFRFDDDPVFGERRLAGLPRQWLTLEAAYVNGDGFHAGPNLVAASSAWVDHANTLKAPGYAVLGFRFGRSKARGLSWFADLRNLADRRYAATTGVLANAGGADARQFLPGDGRSAFFGVEWKP